MLQDDIYQTFLPGNFSLTLSIEYMKKSNQITEDARLDSDTRVRLSGISDLPAAEGKYNFSCLVNFERRVENIRNSGVLSSHYLAMQEHSGAWTRS